MTDLTEDAEAIARDEEAAVPKDKHDPKKNPTSRRYAFTCYRIETFVPATDKLTAKCHYAVWQTERCPTTGRVHIQGFIHMKSPQRYTAIQKLFGGPNMSFFDARGTDEQNQTYCTKQRTRIEGSRGEIGQPVAGQGVRSDLEGMAKIIMDPQMSRKRLAQEYPQFFLKYPRGVEALMELKEQTLDRDEPPKIICWFGETGTGKTMAATEMAKKKAAKLGVGISRIMGSVGDRFAFHACHTGDVLIIDEFVPSDIKLTQLLQLFDRYPMARGQYMFVTCHEVTRVILITS